MNDARSGPTAPAATVPLDIPEEFDPVRNMPVRTEDTGTWHASRLAAHFAARLVANGAPEDLELAEKVLEGLEACQERRPGNPNHGNYRWEYEDSEVEDLNAVHFVLIVILPMIIRYGDRLNPRCREKLETSIRFALGAVSRMDVSLEYTNIVLKDIANTLLGGELLNDSSFLKRGRDKLYRWLEYTRDAGGPLELNSPVYTPICLWTLSCLANHIRDPEVSTLARMAALRIGLSYALRIHPVTGRLAGPFCRAYDVQPYFEHGVEGEYLRRVVGNGILPTWVGDIPETIPMPRDLTEGYDPRQERMQAVCLSPSFSLGTSTTELDSQAIRFIAGQSSVFLMNFTTPDSKTGGLVYSRYIMDDKWHGGFRPTPSRDYSQFLCEEGRFLGVQRGSACIGAYAPRDLGAMEFHTAAKLAIIVTTREMVEEIAIDGEVVASLPDNIPDGSVICFGFSDSLLAIRPFSRTLLGTQAPIRIVERDGHLVLEIYNYLGARKTFWELAQPGSFYQGQPQCAFYAEAAERSAHGDARQFSRLVMSGSVTDVVAPIPDSQSRSGQREWQLGYTRDDAELGLHLDLMSWHLLARSVDGQPLPYTQLHSVAAKQGSGRELRADGAILDPGQANLWIHGNTATQTWVVGGLVDLPSTWRLALPGKTLCVSGFRHGTVTVRKGIVRLDANPETTWTWQ